MSELNGICVVCQTPTKLKCTLCLSVFYCGKEHQKQDWRQHKAICRAYNVGPSPSNHGRIVVSTRKIQTGDIVVSEAPLVVGLHYKEDLNDICLGCYQNLLITSRCPQCGWPVCSPRCLGIRDPTRHGMECDLLKKIQVPMFKTTYILPLRCLLLQKCDPPKWKIFREMAIKAVDVKPTHPSRESRIVFKETILKPLARKAPGLLPDCSEDIVRDVFNVLDMFGLEVNLPDFGPFVAVCRVASLMEHSCLPNTRRFVDIPPVSAEKPWGLRLIVRATETIPKGCSISALFTDTWACTFARQNNLLSRRNAPCNCARCSDRTELGTNFGTLKCSECAGWVLPVNPPEVHLCDWECETCGHVYSPVYVRNRLCQVQNDMAGFLVELEPDARRYKAMLVQLHKVLHPNHHYCLLMERRMCSYYEGSMFDMCSGRQPEEEMTIAQLEMVAEFNRHFVGLLEHRAIVTHQDHGGIVLSDCLRQLASVNSEMANRKLRSGEWSK